MNRLKSIILTVFGCAITGFAVSTFLTPNKIVGGGVSGLSTIFYQTLKVPPGLTFALVNILLLIISFKVLGKEFVFKTLVGAGLISLFVQIFSYLPPFTENTVLATIFGGFLYGLGIALSFVAGATTGGTDVLGRLIQYKFPYLPIGNLLLIVDSAVILTSLIIFKNFDLALFGIISLFVSTYSIDFVIRKLNVSKIAFVVTDKGEEIAHYLISTSPRGVTLIDTVGAYKNAKNKMLFCALKSSEVEAFQRKILELDSTAFIVYSESQQIKGNGFLIYR